MQEPTEFTIFICYRQEDASGASGRIYDHLKDAFGRDAIFNFVNAIRPGYDFPRYIASKLRKCRVVLIVIGRFWSTVVATDGPYKGKTRLSDPADHVRIEVEQALELASVTEGKPSGNLLLIPLLVDDARMPHEVELPESLRPLTDRQARTIRSDSNFDADMQLLIDDIAEWMGISTTEHSRDGGAPEPPLSAPPDHAADAPRRMLHGPRLPWIFLGAAIALIVVALSYIASRWLLLPMSADAQLTLANILLYTSAGLAGAVLIAAVAYAAWSRQWLWLGALLLLGLIPFLLIRFTDSVIPFYFTSIVSLCFGYSGRRGKQWNTGRALRRAS